MEGAGVSERAEVASMWQCALIPAIPAKGNREDLVDFDRSKNSTADPCGVEFLVTRAPRHGRSCVACVENAGWLKIRLVGPLTDRMDTRTPGVTSRP